MIKTNDQQLTTNNKSAVLSCRLLVVSCRLIYAPPSHKASEGKKGGGYE